MLTLCSLVRASAFICCWRSLQYWSSLRLFDVPQIWLERPEAFRKLLLRVVVRDGSHDDDLFAILPVHRSRNRMFCRELKGIDHAHYFIEIAARGHGISNH